MKSNIKVVMSVLLIFTLILLGSILLGTIFVLGVKYFELLWGVLF